MSTISEWRSASTPTMASQTSSATLSQGSPTQNRLRRPNTGDIVEAQREQLPPDERCTRQVPSSRSEEAEKSEKLRLPSLRWREGRFHGPDERVVVHFRRGRDKLTPCPASHRNNPFVEQTFRRYARVFLLTEFRVNCTAG